MSLGNSGTSGGVLKSGWRECWSRLDGTRYRVLVLKEDIDSAVELLAKAGLHVELCSLEHDPWVVKFYGYTAWCKKGEWGPVVKVYDTVSDWFAWTTQAVVGLKSDAPSRGRDWQDFEYWDYGWWLQNFGTNVSKGDWRPWEILT